MSSFIFFGIVISSLKLNYDTRDKREKNVNYNVLFLIISDIMYLKVEEVEFWVTVSTILGTPWIELIFKEDIPFPTNYIKCVEHALEIVKSNFNVYYLRDIYVKGRHKLLHIKVLYDGRLSRPTSMY